jgi:hypothetical protein
MNLSPTRIGIILATLVTAYIHLSLYPYYGRPDPIVLNGLGYLGLLGAYILPIALFQQKHKLVWWVMVGYTVLTIILWVVMGNKDFSANAASQAGYYAKAAELVLLGFLFADKPKS